MGFHLKLDHIKVLYIEGSHWGDTPHSHDDVYQISVPLSGQVITELNQKTLDLKEGAVLITNPHSRHAHQFDVPSSMFLIGLDRKSLNAWNNNNSNEEISFIEQQTISPVAVKKQVKQWFDLYLFHSHEDTIIKDIENEAFQLFTSFFRGSHSVERKQHLPRISDHLILHVLDFIHTNYHEEINVDTLAAIANQSKYHFMRSFKNYTNLSPHQYVIRTRIERSKELLTNTSRSIWDIGYEVGFNNPSQFHRNFVSVVECTPLQYRMKQ
ncbi:helix-turn-helix domain-containing protein [Fictibacillus nanhaiensis]|uniref:helix-turn-helix domain-containing protein n=1 Tax=Fictibacillus nanhaiensis TaxID=742169 RepID=UPI003C1D9FB9